MGSRRRFSDSYSVRSIPSITVLIGLCLFSQQTFSARGGGGGGSTSLSCSSAAGKVVLNELFIQNPQFIEIAYLENITTSGWELCWLKHNGSGDCTAFPDDGSHAQGTYDVYDVTNGNSSLGQSTGEVILKDGAGDVVDHLQYCHTSSCGTPDWEVSDSSCSSTLTNHSSSNKDMARKKDGTGPFKDNGKDHTKGGSNDEESGSAFAFNCVETGSDPIAGHLYTKMVGQAVSFDVVALKDADSDGLADSVETDFASDADRAVTVELVDSSSGVDCVSYPALTPAASQSLLFSAADSGSKTSATFALGKAYSSLRCRITDSNGSTPVVGCSSDPFSVRPASLTVTAPVLSNGSSSGTPTGTAGAAFTLSAVGGTGYNGTPRIDQAQVAAHAGAVQTGVLSGGFGAADPSTGTATGDAFSYSEVGNFRFLADGVIDDDFTSVDQPGDCTDDFSGTPVGGKVGCKFGNTSPSGWVGRFIPADLLLAVDRDGALANTCGSFSYLGEDVTFSAGQTPQVGITARNMDGAITRNYTGDYNKLQLSGINMPDVTEDASQAGAVSGNVGLTWNLGIPSLTDNGDGTLTFELAGDSFTYARTDNELVAQFTADINLTITSVEDDDSVTGVVTPLVLSPAGVTMRYGRIAASNVHGSELTPLNVPLQSEYFAGAATGFVVNTDDNCSTGLTLSLTDPDASDGVVATAGAGRNTAIYADASVAGGYAADDLSDLTLLFVQPAMAGGFNLNLQAPGQGNTGTAVVNVTVPAWLEYDWDGSGMSGPTASATFGIFHRPGAIIYQREAR